MRIPSLLLAILGLLTAMAVAAPIDKRDLSQELETRSLEQRLYARFIDDIADTKLLKRSDENIQHLVRRKGLSKVVSKAVSKGVSKGVSKSVKKSAPKSIPRKAASSRKAAPARKSAPRKSSPTRKSAPARKSAPRKSSPSRKSAPARKSASRKSASSRKSSPARKSARGKSARARKSSPARKSVGRKGAASRKGSSSKKGGALRKTKERKGSAKSRGGKASKGTKGSKKPARRTRQRKGGFRLFGGGRSRGDIIGGGSRGGGSGEKKTYGKGCLRGCTKASKGFKKMVHDVAKPIVKAAQKAIEWVADKAAPIVKFGAKIVATAASLVSRIPIPGLSKIAKGVAKGADIVSNLIPAKLPDNLNKGMEVMDAIQNPIGAAVKAGGKQVAGSETAAKVMDAIFKRDEEEAHLLSRDLAEGEHELLERSLD